MIERALELIQSGRLLEAERHLRGSLADAPQDVDLLHLLGLLCHQSGRSDEAVELIGRAVAHAPEVAFLRANFAEVLRVCGRLDAALEHALAAVRLDPQQANFQFNLAMVLEALGRPESALQALQRALVLQPQWVEALTLAARLSLATDQLDAACEYARRACALRPDDPLLFIALMRYRAWVCDWGTRGQDLARLNSILIDWAARAESAAYAGINPFVAHEYALPQSTRIAATRAYCTGVLRSAGDPLPPRRVAAGSARLRLGYVSADFHRHPTMHLMRSLFALHERSRFEVHAYSLGPDDGSDYRRAAMQSVDRFVDIRTETAADSAKRIHDDAIDILIDLKGYTHEARPEIFALKPAPLRVAWLGYPASTGWGLNDYALVDRIVAPEEYAAEYGEKLVWMPHSYQVNDYRQPIAAHRPARADLGLPTEGFVYACFNKVYKIEPEVFAAWMRILARVPGSVLWLYADKSAARVHLGRAAAAAGIAPERLVFGDTLPKAQHLARLAQADLFLDTLTVNAHTSASDALWAGVPVLTCLGETFASRVGASLVAAAGLPQLACSNLTEYEDCAIRLASAPKELRGMRAILDAHEKLPLFDTPRFVRDLEWAYAEMWRRYLAGLAPAHFDVASNA